MRAPGVLRRHVAGRSGGCAGVPGEHREDAAVPCPSEAEELPAAAAAARGRGQPRRSRAMKSRFDELLPFYVNGSLSDADRAWVDAYLHEHPAALAELNWYRSLQTKLREDVPAVSSEVGMERALRRIRTEGPAPQNARRAVAPSTVWRWWTLCRPGRDGSGDAASPASSVRGRAARLRGPPVLVGGADPARPGRCGVGGCRCPPRRAGDRQRGLPGWRAEESGQRRAGRGGVAARPRLRCRAAREHLAARHDRR